MTERLAGRDIIRATEAATDDNGTQWITIIKEGVSENNRRYHKSTLQKAVDERVYENMRMFVDHSDGPPLKRSMRDLVSAITTTKLDTSFPDKKARVRGAVEWIDDDWQKKIEKGKDHVGVSHDALLRGTRSMKNGRRYEDIDEIPRVNSVDWVIYPSAGGGFENSFLAQEGVDMKDAIDWDAIDEDMLKEHKPDLYKSLTARGSEAEEGDEDEEETEEDEEETPAQESKKSKGSKKVVKIKKSKVQRQVEDIVRRSFEAVEQERQTKQEVHSKVEELVNKSTLPDLTKKRVIASFDGKESFEEDRVKEAITAAKAEVAAIAGPRIRGMGPSGGTTKSTKSFGRAHEAVEKAFGRGLRPKKTIAVKPTGKKGEDEDEDEEDD